jgi:hypothetical protein
VATELSIIADSLACPAREVPIEARKDQDQSRLLDGREHPTQLVQPLVVECMSALLARGESVECARDVFIGGSGYGQQRAQLAVDIALLGHQGQIAVVVASED